MLSALLSGVCCVGPVRSGFPGPIVESGFIGLGLLGREVVAESGRVGQVAFAKSGLLVYWITGSNLLLKFGWI